MKAYYKTPFLQMLSNITRVTFIFLMLGLCAFNMHPFYLSICQINFNDKSESLEIALKVFTTDLASALKEKGHGELFIGEEKEDQEADMHVNAYLKERFQIEIDGEVLQYEFLGKETEGDATWCYLEIASLQNFTSIKVTSQIFTDLFEGQKNIIHVKKGQKEKSILLQKDKDSENVIF